MDSGSWLGRLIRAWKEKNGNTRDKEIQGIGMYMNTWKWTQIIKLFISYDQAHQIASNTEEVFNNHRDRALKYPSKGTAKIPAQDQ